MNLEYFVPAEFDLSAYGGRDWWPQMCPEILGTLDEVRRQLGSTILISPVKGALGRYLGLSYSDHNVERWREVRCADIFPAIDQNTESALEFVNLCTKAGATAVGLYPHWFNRHGHQQVGFHVGYRPERTDSPAFWGMIRYKRRGMQHMVRLEEAALLVGKHPQELR